MPERPGKELYDDVAWYEGRYPSQLNAGAPEGPRRGRTAAARLDTRRAVAAASETGENWTHIDIGLLSSEDGCQSFHQLQG